MGRLDGAIASVGDTRIANGFEVEFLDADGRVRRGPLSSWWSVLFETVRAVRGFPSFKGQRSFPGWWYSSTMDSHVGYESWLERDHAMVLDYDRQIVAYCSQPFWLYWIDGDGRRRRHAPDYFARRGDGGGLVIDVRADDRIKPEDAEAFAATELACKQVGWEFRRVGVLPLVVSRNLRWLSRYRHRRCSGTPGVADRLLAAFTKPMPLFDGAVKVGDALATLPVVYHLIWHQLLTADLASAALGPSTVVRAEECRA